MGLALIRTTATVAAGATYTPNALLSDYFSLTLTPGAGTTTIAQATNVGVGQFVAIELKFNFGTTNYAFAPIYMLGPEQTATHTIVVPGESWYFSCGFFWNGMWFQKVWATLV